MPCKHEATSDTQPAWQCSKLRATSHGAGALAVPLAAQCWVHDHVSKTEEYVVVSMTTGPSLDPHWTHMGPSWDITCHNRRCRPASSYYGAGMPRAPPAAAPSRRGVSARISRLLDSPSSSTATARHS